MPARQMNQGLALKRANQTDLGHIQTKLRFLISPRSTGKESPAAQYHDHQ